MDIWSFVLILNFGLVITAAVVWCSILIYRRIRAYRNGDEDYRGGIRILEYLSLTLTRNSHTFNQ